MSIPNLRGTNVNPNPNLNPGGTTNTTATTATTATTGVQSTSTTPAQTTPVGNPNASGAPAVVVRKVSGLPAGFDANVYGRKNSSNAASEGLTGGYIARPSSNSFVGYGDVTAVKPTQDGFTIDLAVYTKSHENVALVLQLPILDKKSGKLTYLNLDVLTARNGAFVEDISSAQVKDPVSGQQCFGGTRSYTFSLSQINEYLKKTGLGVQLKPGDQLSVSGLTETTGHRVMNAASNAFTVPKPTVQNATSGLNGRIGALTGQTQVKAQDLPLDISLKLPKSLLDEQVYLDGVGWLAPSSILEGDITTRLESEYKGSVDAGQMNKMVTRAYELVDLSERAAGGDAGARKKLDRLLGPGIELHPVKRHWMCSDGEPLGTRDVNNLGVDSAGKAITLNKDAQGWPFLDPMKDGYSDDKKLTFSNESGAARVRGNKQKMGHAEFKIGQGALDPKTGIRQRVETGLSLKAGATEDQLKALLHYIKENPGSKLAQSPLGHIIEEARKGNVLEALTQDRTPWADVTQIRHKFELKNTKTGTSAELSLDMVTAQTLRKEHEVNGQPQVREYYVIETELDHLQINSSNVTELTDAKSKAAQLDTASQESWISTTAAAAKPTTAADGSAAAPTVELEVLSKPQLHSNEHVTDGSFRQTGSYKDFEGMQEHLLAALCDGFKPGPARQKSAHFAELLGLIAPENTVTI